MIYKRKLKPVLLKEISTPQIVVVTGMRQVGKTTLLLDIYNSIESENKVFIDLENPLNQKIFEEKNYDNILLNLKEVGLKSHKNAFVFIDEIQIMPEIVKPIKYLYDHYRIKFFLTGSSSFYLKGLFPESLAGRKIIYELFPLDFEEFLTFKEKEKKFASTMDEKAKNKNKINYEIFKNYYDEYLTFGGFPAVVNENDAQRKRMILGDIFKSYFEKDVRSLSDFKSINKLRDTILLLASRCGSKIEISKISSEIEVSRETLYSYITFLEKTYFISLVQPFSKSINGEVRGARKVYFCDTGLLNYLVKISEGSLFENAVFNSLKKMGKINYHERYKGGEIDFIIDGEIGIEVKINATEADLRRLKRLADKLRLKNFFIVSKNFSDLENVIMAQDL
ncbi:MAG: ATP-binding protein [Candidatus Omnitrophica bacterium]|nr:ATP-binding protein [Candidatus Omnitrophota bacterium]